MNTYTDLSHSKPKLKYPPKSGPNYCSFFVFYSGKIRPGDLLKIDSKSFMIVDWSFNKSKGIVCGSGEMLNIEQAREYFDAHIKS